MAAKVISALISFLILAAVGIVAGFFLLVALNGFGERDAMWGLGTYVLLVLVIAAGMSFAAVLIVGAFAKRQVGQVMSIVITGPICVVVGTILIFVSTIVAAGVTNIVSGGRHT